MMVFQSPVSLKDGFPPLRCSQEEKMKTLFNHMRTIAIQTVLFAFVLGACSVAQNPEPGQPAYINGALALADIPGGFEGPAVISKTSFSATIRFDSGVPTVCNAPYGETTDYGQVATLPMMDGATLDHVLTFSNLKPDTLYHYEINATDNQGNVYQSGDFTFRTEPEQADPNAGETNWLSLQSGARVRAVSSNFSGARNDETWGAESAIDGRPDTAWSSDGDGNQAFIEIELPQAVHFERLLVHTRSMSNNTAQIYSFSITTGSGEVYGPFELEDAAQAYTFEVDFTADVLRFEAVDTNGGNTGFFELAGFGQAAGP
jgi:hypothetical protein